MKNWIINNLEISHGDHSSLKAMEGLRGVAVFLVFLVHYSSLIMPWLTNEMVIISSFVMSFGHLGVDLFFILSGYLIYGTLMNKKQFMVIEYVKRRLVRVYPTFLVVLCLYILLSIVFPKESKLPAEIIPLIYYLIQNALLLPGLFDINPIITVAWSLSYEVFYYFIIPVLIFSMSLKKWSSNNRIVLWIAVSVLGFTLSFLYGGPVRLLMFVAGILLFEVQKVKSIKFKSWGTVSFIFSLLLFGFCSFFELNYQLSLVVVFVLFFVFCLNAFCNESFSARWLVLSPLRWLGNMSYSYYLIHGLTLKLLFLIMSIFTYPSQTFGMTYLFLWIPFFIATVIVSFLLFVMIERPLSIITKRKVEPISNYSEFEVSSQENR